MKEFTEDPDLKIIEWEDQDVLSKSNELPLIPIPK